MLKCDYSLVKLEKLIVFQVNKLVENIVQDNYVFMTKSRWKVFFHWKSFISITEKQIAICDSCAQGDNVYLLHFSDNKDRDVYYNIIKEAIAEWDESKDQVADGFYYRDMPEKLSHYKLELIQVKEGKQYFYSFGTKIWQEIAPGRYRKAGELCLVDLQNFKDLYTARLGRVTNEKKPVTRQQTQRKKEKK